MKLYCENCQKDNLKSYVIDRLGSVFCSRKCFMESLEYREIKKVTQ